MAYPTTLDNLSSSHADGTGEVIHAADINAHSTALNTIEALLGLYPRSVSTDVTAAATDSVLLVDASGANRTVTLPAANTRTGMVLRVKKTDTTGNTVTISGTIDGQSNLVLNWRGGMAALLSDGTNYHVIGRYVPTTYRADTFNRANSTSAIGTPSDAGPAWNVGNAGDAATLPTLGISSNAAYLVAAGTQSDPHAWTESYAANARVHGDVTVDTKASTNLVGLEVRRSASNTYYLARLNNSANTIDLLLNNAGTRSVVASASITLADSTTYGVDVDCHDATIEVRVNGVRYVQTEQAVAYTATKHGVFFSGTGAGRVDNFSVVAVP